MLYQEYVVRSTCIMCKVKFSKLDPRSAKKLYHNWCFLCFQVGDNQLRLDKMKVIRSSRKSLDVRRPSYFKGWVHPSGKVTS